MSIALLLILFKLQGSTCSGRYWVDIFCPRQALWTPRTQQIFCFCSNLRVQRAACRTDSSCSSACAICPILWKVFFIQINYKDKLLLITNLSSILTWPSRSLSCTSPYPCWSPSSRQFSSGWLSNRPGPAFKQSFIGRKIKECFNKAAKFKRSQIPDTIKNE